MLHNSYNVIGCNSLAHTYIVVKLFQRSYVQKAPPDLLLLHAPLCTTISQAVAVSINQCRQCSGVLPEEVFINGQNVFNGVILFCLRKLQKNIPFFQVGQVQIAAAAVSPIFFEKTPFWLRLGAAL